MNEFFQDSMFFGLLLSLAAYLIGSWLHKKTCSGLANPLLIAILLTIAVLLVGDIDYDTYNNSAKYLSYLLTPATVCLAVPLYRQLEKLRDSLPAILAGVFAGSLASLVSVLLFSKLPGFTRAEYVTFLPKSITSAIGLSVSEELGGYPSLTVAVIILSGVLGNISCGAFLKLLRIKDPVAKGTAIGTASHAIGTSKALEIGELEGAVSSLSIVIAGILTVLLAPLFAGLY